MCDELDNLNQPQRILNAAFKCISSKGYANVSLRDIADEAGVVLSQLNYYYKNKEGLFIEVIKKLTGQYLNEIEESLKKDDTANEKMHRLVEYFQVMLRKNSELFKLLFDLSSMALWSASLRRLLGSLFDDLSSLIEKYIVNGLSDREELKNYSSKGLSKIILGTLFGTSLQAMFSGEEEGVIDSLSEIRALFT